jgi:2,4-dienoyl-CoA reductase-like NADH-dependent reductase (Old Yellow Enzyme family)
MAIDKAALHKGVAHWYVSKGVNARRFKVKCDTAKWFTHRIKGTQCLSRVNGCPLKGRITVRKLFSPITLRGVEFPNRLWVSPMCQYSATDGVVGSWHLMHLGSLATGGAGLIIAEATAVAPEGRISVACPGLWNQAQVHAWRKVTDFVHEQGSLIGVQLAHAGRKGSTLRPWDESLMATPDQGGWTAVAPSAIAYGAYPVPAELSTEAVQDLVRDFVAAAQRAIDAGFDVLEVHAAHGYLINSFLSPLSNQRSDQYGGDFENRIRFLVEIVEGIRATISAEVPLLVRISATEWAPGGWDSEDSVALAGRLQALGVDLMDVSTGGSVHDAQIPVGPNFQTPFATAIREQVSMPVSTVGLIDSAAQAEGLLVEGAADVILAARPFLRNPRWALEVAKELGVEVPWPGQFMRAKP